MNKLLTLLALTFALSAFSQPKTDKAEILEGPEVPSKKSVLSDIVGSDPSGYYIVRTAKRKKLLEHMDKSLVTDKSVEIPVKMDYNGHKRYYFGVLKMAKKMYLISTCTDKENKTFYVFAQGIDKNSLAIDQGLQMVYSTTYESNRDAPYYFPYTVSEDSTRLLFHYSGNKSREEGNERIHFYVCDENLKQLWDREVELPYASDLFSIDQIRVDNDGNPFITGIEYQDKSTSRQSRREGKPNYKYHLLSYKEKGSRQKDYPIELDNYFITDMRIGIADNGDLISTGFYSEKGSYSIKGAFYMSIDGESRRVKKEKTTAFEKDFITQNMTDREKKKVDRREKKGEDPELYQFSFDNLIIQNDGGATLIAEQYYVIEHTYTTTDSQGHTKTRTTYTYVYNDIIALSFASDGTLSWKTKIGKRQATNNDGGYYSSYAYAAVGNKLYLIFNDNPKNLFLAEGEVPYSSFGKEIAVSLVTIDASTGKSSRELLMTGSRHDLIIRPKMCFQTGEREMLVYGVNGRKSYQFRKLTLQK